MNQNHEVPQQWSLYQASTGVFILMRADSTGTTMIYRSPDTGLPWYSSDFDIANERARKLSTADEYFTRAMAQERVCTSQAEVLHLWKRDARSMADQLDAADCKMSADDLREMADRMQELQDHLNEVAQIATYSVTKLCADLQEDPFNYHPLPVKLPEQKELNDDED